MKNKLMGLLKDDAGQAMTEYGLILALVAVVAIATLVVMGPKVAAQFTKVTTAIPE